MSALAVLAIAAMLVQPALFWRSSANPLQIPGGVQAAKGGNSAARLLVRELIPNPMAGKSPQRTLADLDLGRLVVRADADRRSGGLIRISSSARHCPLIEAAA